MTVAGSSIAPLRGRRSSPIDTAVPAHSIAGYRFAETATACLLAGPAFLLLLALFILPVAAVFVIALTDWQFGALSLRFVGLANFRDVFADAGFRASLANTVRYGLLVVPATVIGGLAFALLIESAPSLRSLYRAIYFLPFMATMAAMAVAWQALLHPTIGLFNATLSSLGLPTANWLRSEETVLPVLAAIGIWQNLGFAVVLFLAGLKSIPQDLYDAAAIDGVDSLLDRLRTVTLPMLSPVFMFVTIVMALRAFEAFDSVRILTQGGPGHASELLLYTLYRESFEYLHAGYGAAITIVFLVIAVALTLIQAQAFERRVHYQ